MTTHPARVTPETTVRRRPMLVRFTKNAPSAPADTLTCTRSDGTVTVGDLPRQGILPRDAFHFVVETTLGWRDAFFGQIAAGATFDDLGVSPSKKTQLLQASALVECLEATQWGGTPDDAAFAKTLAAACRRRRVPPPDLTAADLARVRHALREFGAAWRPLNPGQSLERTFGARVPQ
jgi:hypothetical protein